MGLLNRQITDPDFPRLNLASNCAARKTREFATMRSEPS